jgi:hypothetical protein
MMIILRSFSGGCPFACKKVQEKYQSVISRSGLELFIGIYSLFPTILEENMFLSVRLLYICTGFELESSSYMEYSVSGLCAMIEGR